MPEHTINFTVNPDQTPILAVDGYLISSNEYLFTLSFAQALPGDGDQQQIVSRVAMNPKQAKEFLEKLSDHIQKFEI